MRYNNLPIFLCEYKKNEHVYGIPDFGDGIKIGFHHVADIVDDPDKADRTQD
jgi:hypothetical protein